LGHDKDFKNGICCFSCFHAQHLKELHRRKRNSQ